MKQTKLPVYLMLLATLSAGSCSNEDTPDTLQPLQRPGRR